MKSNQHTFAELAQQLAGCRLLRTLRSQIIFANDFGSCRAWAEFESGAKLELVLAASDDLIEFPAEFDVHSSYDVLTEVDGISLNQFEVMGLCVAEATYSYGIILKNDTPLVLCLDTTAGLKLDLQVYPLHEILSAGGQAFFS